MLIRSSRISPVDRLSDTQHNPLGQRLLSQLEPLKVDVFAADRPRLLRLVFVITETIFFCWRVTSFCDHKHKSCSVVALVASSRQSKSGKCSAVTLDKKTRTGCPFPSVNSKLLSHSEDFTVRLFLERDTLSDSSNLNLSVTQKKAVLVDVTLTFAVAPKDYTVTIVIARGCQLRRSTGTIPKHFVIFNQWQFIITSIKWFIVKDAICENWPFTNSYSKHKWGSISLEWPQTASNC